MLNTLTNFMASVNDTDISSLLTSIGSATGFNVTVTDMLFALILSVVMGFLISLVYIFTHRKSGYTQSYVLTILMLPPIIAIVLVMINSMASALSLAGVFTLCRYRTVPGDPKDITYVFFAMAVGVICGIKITIPENLNYVGLFDDVLNENTASWHLKRVKTTNFGSLFELVYSIQLKNQVDQKKFMDDLRKLNGNLTVILSLYRYEDQVYDK